eukprot:3980931-Prorocentrum_lima.AAC.1
MPQKIRERLKVHKPHLTLIKDFDGLIEQLDAILVNLKSERKSESNNQKKTGAGGGKGGNTNSSSRNDKNTTRNRNDRNKGQPVDGGCAHCKKNKPDSFAWKNHSTAVSYTHLRAHETRRHH